MNAYIATLDRTASSTLSRAERIRQVIERIPDQIAIHFATGFHGKTIPGQPAMTITLETSMDPIQAARLLPPLDLERGAPGFPTLLGTRTFNPIGPYYVNLHWGDRHTNGDLCWITEVDGVTVRIKRPISGVHYGERHERNVRNHIVRHHWERVTPFKGYAGDGKLIDEVHPPDMESLIWTDVLLELDDILKDPSAAW